MAAVLIPIYRIVLPEDAVDPMWMRYALAAAAIGIVLLTFLPQTFRKNLPYIVGSYSFIATLWILYLTWQNDLDSEYATSYFILVFCATILYSNLGWLLTYFAANFALSLAIAFSVEQPDFNPQLFVIMASSVIGASTLALMTKFRERDDLRMGQQLLRIINQASFQSSNQAILVTDSEGKILHQNSFFLFLWETTEQELAELGDNPELQLTASRIGGDESLLESLHYISKNPGGKTFDEFKLKDGRYIERVSRPLKHEGQLLGRIWFYRDISSAKQQEASLIA
ncbi:MAG: hypothetical protein AAF570_20845, partial [Bacteroidota bacterium]